MSRIKLFFSILFLLLLHCSFYQTVLCHGRVNNNRHKHGRKVHHHHHHHDKVHHHHDRVHHHHGKKSKPTELTMNMTQYDSEKQFMRWVNFVGSLKHTLFKSAKNKIFPSHSLTVSKNHLTGDFTSIQDAIDSLPPINLVRAVIKVKAGTYKEKVNIPPLKSFITIEGEGADKTIVQWGDEAKTMGPNGKPLGTFSSATFAVNSPYFMAKNITFKNTTPVPKPGAKGSQGVALRISADTAAFVGCKFLGAQDTLYDHMGRHYYKDCYIEGSVDFIFGNALSLFEGCHVHAIANRYGALTAQGRNSMLDDTGFSFVNCKVTGSGALYLGRAWGPFSRVIFAYTYMDNIIIPKGWYNWGDHNREMTVFYGQYKCTGPGASFAGRVAWSRELTEEEARPFISLSFIDGSEWVTLYEFQPLIAGMSIRTYDLKNQFLVTSNQYLIPTYLSFLFFFFFFFFV